MSISMVNSNQVNNNQENEIMNTNQQTIADKHNVIVSTEISNNVENTLPQVCLPGNGVTLTDTAEAMATVYRNESNPEKRLYNRGGAACCIDKDRNGTLMLTALSAKRACSEFEQVAILGKQKKSKGGESINTFEPDVCSTDTASKVLIARSFLDNLPQINLETSVPVILQGKNNQCRIINSYDEASGIFPTGIPVEDIPLADAVQLLQEAISDFNFQSKGDKSRAIAALLTPALVAGGVLDARAPVMMLEADKSQSGKGFFTKILGAIYNETPVTVTQRERGTGGLDENFDAALCSGRQLIVLDNLRGKMNSPQIEAFLTSDLHMARMPYAPQIAVEPKRYFIMATSNNFELTVDMANRSNIIRILKQREGFRFRSFAEGDILAHIKANQPKYLGAIFAVIREWVSQGKPRQASARHDFRDWCRAMDWIIQNIFHCVPLMEGHQDAKMMTMHPEANWVKGLFKVANGLDELNKPLTAHQLAEYCELEDLELPGSQGFSLSDLDDKGKAQVCSQIGRRFSSLFRKLGNEGEINLGSFVLQRKSQKMTYASGKTENAIVYLFSSLA